MSFFTIKPGRNTHRPERYAEESQKEYRERQARSKREGLAVTYGVTKGMYPTLAQAARNTVAAGAGMAAKRQAMRARRVKAHRAKARK